MPVPPILGTLAMCDLNTFAQTITAQDPRIIMRQELRDLLKTSVSALIKEGVISVDVPADVHIERTRQEITAILLATLR
ncbi:MAG: hypothetical protein Ct9H300mP14_01840 [Gammaproteobacteria bacterium]|nr:MAG: hypothetical protein Ct9H300mP14_01840 [Gammaproteobacteria bacterium]